MEICHELVRTVKLNDPAVSWYWNHEGCSLPTYVAVSAALGGRIPEPSVDVVYQLWEDAEES